MDEVSSRHLENNLAAHSHQEYSTAHYTQLATSNSIVIINEDSVHNILTRRSLSYSVVKAVEKDLWVKCPAFEVTLTVLPFAPPPPLAMANLDHLEDFASELVPLGEVSKYNTKHDSCSWLVSSRTVHGSTYVVDLTCPMIFQQRLHCLYACVCTCVP